MGYIYIYFDDWPVGSLLALAHALTLFLDFARSPALAYALAYALRLWVPLPG
jgi:hypothetical protein